jgi:hypothetical protein
MKTIFNNALSIQRTIPERRVVRLSHFSVYMITATKLSTHHDSKSQWTAQNKL